MRSRAQTQQIAMKRCVEAGLPSLCPDAVARSLRNVKTTFSVPLHVRSLSQDKGPPSGFVIETARLNGRVRQEHWEPRLGAA
jgi:hypothetical protein